MLFVPTNATLTNPIFVNIWDYAGPVRMNPTTNAVCYYSILPSARLLLDRAMVDPVDDGRVPAAIYGTELPFQGRAFWGDQTFMRDLWSFKLFAQPGAPGAVGTQIAPKVCFAQVKETNIVGYVTRDSKYHTDAAGYYGGLTVRQDNAPLRAIDSLAVAVETGVLGAEKGMNGRAQNFIVLRH
jgi:hypothetical protein